MSAHDEPGYRSHTYVTGALGLPDGDLLRSLLEASPADIEPVLAEGPALLWASQRLRVWRHRERHGHYWNALAADRSPSSWEGAAERRMSAGLAIGPNDATLHTDALGIAELYTRRIGDALYFASRIYPLTQLTDVPLHEDDAAWASTLALGAPVAGATPFAEVRRLEAATAVRFAHGRFERVSFEPAWMDVEPRTNPDPAVVVDLVARQMPRQRLLGRTALTLSGGWDSRLLASLATRASRRRVLGWTTDPDTGYDLDVRLAAPVAAALEMRQRVLVPPPDAWAHDAAHVRRRLQHQTWLHTWIWPLARTLHRRSEPLLDGLAGDVLLKSLLVDRDVLDAAEPERALWDVLAGDRLSRTRDLLADGVADDLEDASRTAFSQASAQFAGHPAGASLSVLTTRTARAIAASPVLLFAPETDVRLPFVHPDVISVSLSVPVDRKIGGDFYREVLDAADPRIARLPSTNDAHPMPTFGPKRQAHPDALRAMRTLIGSDDEVRRMFGPTVQAALVSDEAMADVIKQPRLLNVLQWAAMRAEWRSDYRDTLAS